MKKASHISASVLTCETEDSERRIEAAREEAERKAFETTDQHRRRAWRRFLPYRDKSASHVPKFIPASYGQRTYSPVEKYADGVEAGHFVTYYDKQKALRYDNDPCKPDYYHEYRRKQQKDIFSRVPNAGYVIATFQNYGREGDPIQVALHTGTVLDKRPSDKLWVEESSGFPCESSGPCVPGLAMTSLISKLAENNTLHLQQEVQANFIRILKEEYGEKTVFLAWWTAFRWGLLTGRDITPAGRIWWYAEQRNQGIEKLEGADSVNEKPDGGQQVNQFFWNNTGINQAFASGANAKAISTGSSPDEESKLIAQVVEIVKSGRDDLKLTDEESRELDESLQVLEETASDENRGPSFRLAVRSVLNLAGTLLVGAGGNATWEAFKALVS